MLERPCTLLQQFKVPTDHQRLMQKTKPSTSHFVSLALTYLLTTHLHGDDDANTSSRIIPCIRVHTSIQLVSQ